MNLPDTGEKIPENIINNEVWQWKINNHSMNMNCQPLIGGFGFQGSLIKCYWLLVSMNNESDHLIIKKTNKYFERR